jgi:hypothetical protein
MDNPGYPSSAVYIRPMRTGPVALVPSKLAQRLLDEDVQFDADQVAGYGVDDAVRGRSAPPDCIRRYGRFYFSGKIAIRSPFMVLTQSLLPTSMAPVPAPITP